MNASHLRRWRPLVEIYGVVPRPAGNGDYDLVQSTTMRFGIMAGRGLLGLQEIQGDY